MEVKVTELPEQKVVAPPAEIVGAAGVGFTVTVMELLFGLWQPTALTALQVYVPAVVAEIDCVVAPVDHK